jgi:small acid-soluble spore protein H (minor)
MLNLRKIAALWRRLKRRLCGHTYSDYKLGRLLSMRLKRAGEIAASPVMANVTYFGEPVYIESVSAANKTAVVHPLNQPDNSRRVSVSGLVEHF